MLQILNSKNKFRVIKTLLITNPRGSFIYENTEGTTLFGLTRFFNKSDVTDIQELSSTESLAVRT